MPSWAAQHLTISLHHSKHKSQNLQHRSSPICNTAMANPRPVWSTLMWLFYTLWKITIFEINRLDLLKKYKFWPLNDDISKTWISSWFWLAMAVVIFSLQTCTLTTETHFWLNLAVDQGPWFRGGQPISVHRLHLGKYPKILTFWANFKQKLWKSTQNIRETLNFNPRLGSKNFLVGHSCNICVGYFQNGLKPFSYYVKISYLHSITFVG